MTKHSFVGIWLEWVNIGMRRRTINGQNLECVFNIFCLWEAARELVLLKMLSIIWHHITPVCLVAYKKGIDSFFRCFCVVFNELAIFRKIACEISHNTRYVTHRCNDNNQFLTDLLGNNAFIVPRKNYSHRAKFEGYSFFFEVGSAFTRLPLDQSRCSIDI